MASSSFVDFIFNMNPGRIFNLESALVPEFSSSPSPSLHSSSSSSCYCLCCCLASDSGFSSPDSSSSGSSSPSSQSFHSAPSSMSVHPSTSVSPVYGQPIQCQSSPPEMPCPPLPMPVPYGIVPHFLLNPKQYWPIQHHQVQPVQASRQRHSSQSSSSSDSSSGSKKALCNNILLHGRCERKEKCAFAHNVEELGEKVAKNYKKSWCLNWEATKTCPYGFRCTFLHR